ncbi:MAG: DUF2062 domain-containing protein [Thiomicrospira sp.]|nr:DUF2062 domain-containing protein [Thiomicrospira sp.]
MRAIKLSILKGIRAIKYSRWLNEKFPGLKNKDLWRGERHTFSKAGFIGAFCAFIPIPLQMPLAAIVAYYTRANIPLAVALAWITNPVTMWPIWSFGYFVGAWLLGYPTIGNIELSEGAGMWGWITEVLPQIWIPLWFGNIILGALVGSVLYVTIQFVPLPHFKAKTPQTVSSDQQDLSK